MVATIIVILIVIVAAGLAGTQADQRQKGRQNMRQLRWLRGAAVAAIRITENEHTGTGAPGIEKKREKDYRTEKDYFGYYLTAGVGKL